MSRTSACAARRSGPTAGATPTSRSSIAAPYRNVTLEYSCRSPVWVGPRSPDIVGRPPRPPRPTAYSSASTGTTSSPRSSNAAARPGLLFVARLVMTTFLSSLRVSSTRQSSALPGEKMIREAAAVAFGISEQIETAARTTRCPASSANTCCNSFKWGRGSAAALDAGISLLLISASDKVGLCVDTRVSCTFGLTTAIGRCVAGVMTGGFIGWRVCVGDRDHRQIRSLRLSDSLHGRRCSASYTRGRERHVTEPQSHVDKGTGYDRDARGDAECMVQLAGKTTEAGW